MYAVNCLDNQFFEFCDVDGSNNNGVPASICTPEAGLLAVFAAPDFCGPCFRLSGAQQPEVVVVPTSPRPTPAPVSITLAPVIPVTLAPVAPTVRPSTPAPVVKPTPAPVKPPTPAPSAKPTAKPTVKPTVKPTAKPTVKPTPAPVLPTPAPDVTVVVENEEPSEEDDGNPFDFVLPPLKEEPSEPSEPSEDDGNPFDFVLPPL